MAYITVSCRRCGKAARVWDSPNMYTYAYCGKSCKKVKHKSTKQEKKALERARRRQKKAYKRQLITPPVIINFYQDKPWLELRYRVLREYGAKCMLCNRTRKDGVKMHVDHIKPRSKYPALELDFHNLQVLCEDCNIGKLNLDETDWRIKENSVEPR